MKKLLLAVFSITATFSLYAQREVPQERMEQIYEEVKTPYKYGLAVAPADNYHKIDCPTVFRQGDKWLMTYVVYNGKGGTDGRGYETWIAESDNLLEWRTLGRVLSYRDGKWDCNQRGGFPALPDMEWGGSYELQTYKGRHWMTYIGGEGTGYEAVKAPLYVGLAWTKGDISTAHEWESLDKPILSIHDKDAQWWEKLTQYKSTVYWDKDKTLGAPFVMYYNAGGRHPETDLKGERVGIALSKDMKTWKRYSGNPVFAHEADGTIGGISADTVNRLSRLQIDFRNSNTFGNQTVFRNNGRLPVNNNLGRRQRSFQIAQVVWTIQCPQWTRPHRVILHLICNFFIIGCHCHKDSRRNTVHILHNTMLIQNTAILLQLIRFIQTLHVTGDSMSSDHIRNKPCSV